ncbi:hypothetical protein [Roseateles amylovorans]|uniref:PEP-CTERM protein-sorting domain-containing protein n=1 Tax=Roseateles amylovorans TaxID=2978473 RepID=A0ABY6B9U8_9BURK|nr:hypothetical protein [Roseateles amylovorans]UXH80691.1 hypothetical protein N4261_12765 [Roseateles amylovorans]
MTGFMFSPGRARGLRAALAALAAWGLLLLASTPAHALEFRYSYVGQLFDVQTRLIREDPPNDLVVAPYRIRADIWTSEILAAGATQDDILRFSLTLLPASGGPGQTLTFPGPGDPCCGGSVQTVGSFSIGATGMFALPTVWSLSIDQLTIAPTGRFEQLSLSTSNTRDSISGELETWNVRSGSLSASPGVWFMAVVPEVSSLVLMIAGLLILVVLRATGRRVRWPGATQDAGRQESWSGRTDHPSLGGQT